MLDHLIMGIINTAAIWPAAAVLYTGGVNRTDYNTEEIYF